MNAEKVSYLPERLSNFINNALDIWHVPGLALAIVKDGMVILSEGYGLRDIDQRLPVTPDTLFPIASCTKAFTALALGMLVDAGKLAWDRPVKEYLPTLKLWDMFATERITTRDLLSHRSGLPGHDMMWYATRFNRREIFDRLRFLEPTCDLRTMFQYQNLMYMLAGLVLEEITGMSWQQFIQKQILNPLGMDRTSFSTRKMQQASDYALPYRYRYGSITKMAFQEEMDGENNPLAGAGGIISCANDMTKWLQFWLSGGKVDGQALIADSTLEQILTPQILIHNPQARQCFGYEFMSYGLGWEMRSHKGKFFIEHDGMADGFYALATMMPQAKIGIVALSNSDAYYNPVQDNPVPNIIPYTLYDQLLGVEDTDWNQKMRVIHDEGLLALKEIETKINANTNPVSPLSHPIESYLGEYTHPGYGQISIQKEGDHLWLIMNQKLKLPLVHRYHDIFEAIFEIVDQRQKVIFSMDLEGIIRQLTIPMEPHVNPIIFTRVSQ